METISRELVVYQAVCELMRTTKYMKLIPCPRVEIRFRKNNFIKYENNYEFTDRERRDRRRHINPRVKTTSGGFRGMRFQPKGNLFKQLYFNLIFINIFKYLFHIVCFYINVHIKSPLKLNKSYVLNDIMHLTCTL